MLQEQNEGLCHVFSYEMVWDEYQIYYLPNPSLRHISGKVIVKSANFLLLFFKFGEFDWFNIVT